MIETVLLSVIAVLLTAWTLVAVVIAVAVSRALGGVSELVARVRELVETVAGLAGALNRKDARGPDPE